MYSCCTGDFEAIELLTPTAAWILQGTHRVSYTSRAGFWAACRARGKLKCEVKGSRRALHLAKSLSFTTNTMGAVERQENHATTTVLGLGLGPRVGNWLIGRRSAVSAWHQLQIILIVGTSSTSTTVIRLG